nr:hypothetical protein Iba_chr05aCG1500 [Ipomoea batatas]
MDVLSSSNSITDLSRMLICSRESVSDSLVIESMLEILMLSCFPSQEKQEIAYFSFSFLWIHNMKPSSGKSRAPSRVLASLSPASSSDRLGSATLPGRTRIALPSFSGTAMPPSALQPFPPAASRS